MPLRITIIKFIKEMEGKSKAAIKLLELKPEEIKELDLGGANYWIGYALGGLNQEEQKEFQWQLALLMSRRELLQQQQQYLDEIQEKSEDHQKQNTRLNQKIAVQNQTIASLNQNINNKGQEINGLNHTITTGLNQTITGLNQTIHTVNGLNQTITALNQIITGNEGQRNCWRCYLLGKSIGSDLVFVLLFTILFTFLITGLSDSQPDQKEKIFTALGIVGGIVIVALLIWKYLRHHYLEHANHL